MSERELEDGAMSIPSVEIPQRGGFGGFLLRNWFSIATTIGVLIGLGLGLGLQQIGLDETGRTWIDMPGRIYIRLLKLTIVPIIVASIINSTANLNPKEHGKVIAFAVAFTVVFNLLSPCIGVVYAYIINPGKYYGIIFRGFAAAIQYLLPVKVESTSYTRLAARNRNSENKISHIIKDFFLNIFPDSINGMTLHQTGTDFDKPQRMGQKKIVYPSIVIGGANMIGILVVSLVIGIALQAAREKGEALKRLFVSIEGTFMLIIEKFLLITPVCAMFLVMSSVASVNDFRQTFLFLSLLVVANLVGQVTHLTLLMLSIVIYRKNPFRILRYAGPTYFVAFASTSSVACLPKAFLACDEYGIPKKISRLVLPFVTIMKSDASAIFIATSCLFAAQQQNIQLDAGSVVVIIVLSFAYAAAMPNVPSASVVAVITILGSIGVDPGASSLLYAVEWINDRLRSGNVALSHLYCTLFAYHSVERDFVKMEDYVWETEDSESSVDSPRKDEN